MTNVEEVKRISDYPWRVLDGSEMACVYIQMACKRFVSWLDMPDRYFDVDAVYKVFNFIRKLKHFSGTVAGKNFELEPFQKFIIMGVYGWKWKKNNLRITRTFILSIARKSGKSSLLSAMALYALISGEEASPEVCILANSAKQAGILFSMASNYLKSIDKRGKYFDRYRDSIKCPAINGKIQVLSSDATNLDGYSPSFCVVDETSNAPSSACYDVMESGMGARRQPLMCCCTTRSFELAGFYHELEENAIEVLNGTKTDDSLFVCIYTLDENDDYKDKKVWRKCQPNLGISVSEDYIEQQVLKAQNNPVQQVSILTKIFNKWVSSRDGWLPMECIWACEKKIDLNDYKDLFCYCSFDLASVCDLTALSVMIPVDGKFVYKTYYYLPQDSLANNENEARYRSWAQQGYLTLTEGNVTDYAYILNDLMNVSKICPIVRISYDPWGSTQFVIDCTNQGLPVEPYSQSIGSMNRPTKEMERLVRGGQVVIDKNPITEFCFNNAVVRYDWNDNCRIIKNSVMQKIDGAIAMIMALGGYLSSPNVDTTIFTMQY